ncbi:MAG TPA: lipopolysaccharide assembly protein LapA domain-containing protein [Brevibacterium sp.]|nr:lipopolysaccharide assembly protein LapA domain-containing protein [Brevibacterium sp.]
MTTNPDPYDAQSPSPAGGTGQGSENLSDSLPPELLNPDADQPTAQQPSTGAPARGGAGAPVEHQRNPQDIPAADAKGGLSGGVWVSLILGAIITIMLLVFIIQNNTAAQFQYFGWSFSLPLGVAMLLAAIAGVLVAGIIGSVRIFILSRRLKKVQKAIGG